MVLQIGPGVPLAGFAIRVQSVPSQPVEQLAMGSAPYVSRLAKEMGRRIAGGDRAMKRMKRAIVARIIT